MELELALLPKRSSAICEDAWLRKVKQDSSTSTDLCMINKSIGVSAGLGVLVEQGPCDEGLAARAAVEPLASVNPLVDFERALLPERSSTIC